MTVPPQSFSFSGCAWLVAYHFGVGRVLQRRTDTSRHVYLGTSSGAIAAAVLAVGVDCDDAFGRLISLAHAASTRRLGPAGLMSRFVRTSLEDLIPEQGHQALFGRLHVSVTELPRVRNRILPRAPFASREELICVILASCYIPLYYERPVLLGGRPYVDGGLTDNQPVLGASTITVSPTGASRGRARIDITPARPPALRHALLPDPEVMIDVYDAGRADAELFLASPSWTNRESARADTCSQGGMGGGAGRVESD
jgi:hypothetical protein